MSVKNDMNLPVFLLAGSSEPASLYIDSTLHVGKKSDLFGGIPTIFLRNYDCIKRTKLDISFYPKDIDETQCILCTDHGVRYPAVSWAYEGSRFTKDFDRTAAWLACQLSRMAVAEYMRIDRETVGRCISRARKDIEPDLKTRLDGLVHIGIDETSYIKGHKYLTVIVDHDRNRGVWLHDGHGKSVLEKFYEELTEDINIFFCRNLIPNI